MTKTQATDAYWRTFANQPDLQGTDYQVVAFGNTPKMASELAAFVVAGTKRATAGLLRDFTEGGEPMPVAGGYVVCVDGTGTPQCIWRTSEVEIGPLNTVDEQFAWDEGEGERTRAWWLAGHIRYFTRQAEREGFAMHDAIETVFERFIVVWPAEIADA